MSRYDWPRDTGRRKDSDDPGARGGFIARRRVEFDPEGALAAGRGLRASHAGLPGPFAPATGRKHLWQPLGPMTILRGQAIGEPRIAGRINAFDVHFDGKRAYAASANGGVWYTNDGGVKWISLGGFAETGAAQIIRPAHRHACGSIRVLFGATEATDVVYVGTGETTHHHDAQPGHSLGGVGVLIGDHPVTAPDPNPWVREAKNLLGEGVCRIAVQPGGSKVVAGSTIGLFERPSAPAADNDWSPVAGTPFDTLTDKCADVLWTAAAGARPERLWVWVQGGSNAGLWVRSGNDVNFEKIITPGSSSGRAVLAAPNTEEHIFVLNDLYDRNREDVLVPPAFFRVANADATKPVATSIAGVPQILGKQGFYDIALAVHPTSSNRVVLGGNTFDVDSPDGSSLNGDGAIVVGDVALNGAILTFGHPSPFTMVGVGVHADVHDLMYSNAGDRLWAACDGGVYRSDSPTKQVGFFAVNDGLAVIESNYIASHPTCEGYLVAGLQDNGMISRRSNSVWQNAGDGDGGGVAFDPLRPTRFFRQYHNEGWSSSDGTFKVPTAKKEKSAFYSTPAAIGHRRGVAATAPPDVGQIIIGTRRVWYTENFGATWVTLPKGVAPPAANLDHDDFGQKITVCRWQSPDVAWVLSEGRLKRYSRTTGSDTAGGPGTWTAATVIEKGEKNKKDATSADGPIRDAAVWTDIAVNLDPAPGPKQPPTMHGTNGAVYLGTIGSPDDSDVDTLWWFDGTSKWFKTGLRTDPKGVPAPVTAIVCDPDFPEEVYVGTTVGVWKGTRTQVGDADPAWTWAARVNGLPEAAVEDLAIFSDVGIRLLRAGIAARGVWELRLDVSDVVDLTYVRAHDDDLRYRVPPLVEPTGTARVLKQRDLLTDRSWHGSPDVRPRRAPLPVKPPAPFPFTRFTAGVKEESLRRFQCALRSRTGDQRVRPTGKWDNYFNEVLRDLGAPLMPSPPADANTVCIDKDFWDLSMTPPHSTAEPWGTGVPSEADLYELTAELKEGELERSHVPLPAQELKVDIVVHHRGLDPVDGANVRVTLLKWIDPKKKLAAKRDDHTTWFKEKVPWTAAVNEVLNPAGGTTTLAFADGWSFVGTTNATRRQTLAGQTLDSTHSGIATFDLDLTGLKKNTVVLLVAVIRAGTAVADELTSEVLEELALTSPNVAVRSMYIDP